MNRCARCNHSWDSPEQRECPQCRWRVEWGPPKDKLAAMADAEIVDAREDPLPPASEMRERVLRKMLDIVENGTTSRDATARVGAGRTLLEELRFLGSDADDMAKILGSKDAAVAWLWRTLERMAGSRETLVEWCEKKIAEGEGFPDQSSRDEARLRMADAT